MEADKSFNVLSDSTSHGLLAVDWVAFISVLCWWLQKMCDTTFLSGLDFFLGSSVAFRLHSWQRD